MRHAARLTAPPHARVPSVLRLGPRVGPWTSVHAAVGRGRRPGVVRRRVRPRSRSCSTRRRRRPTPTATRCRTRGRRSSGSIRAIPRDAGGDPDGDGLTNAQEFAARRHPVGLHTRYFAEGSTGFFDTSVAVAQPEPDRHGARRDRAPGRSGRCRLAPADARPPAAANGLDQRGARRRRRRWPSSSNRTCRSPPIGR